MEKMKTALIIGATGLVGSKLVEFLLKDNSFDQVGVFVRRSINLKNPKLVEHLIDFDRYESWKHLVKGDVLFSCLGTTLKKAGSEEAQYRVDHTYQLQFAKAAEENGVQSYALISSAGADPESRNFYLKMKGQLENDVKDLNFEQLAIIRPGLLKGEREESRRGEKAAEIVLRFFNGIGLFRKYRPVPADTVALAMIRALKSGDRYNIYELDEVFDLAAE